MFNGPSAQAFAAATAPLIANFGTGLTLWRDGDVVHWAYDGQSVVVALRCDGLVDATFLDRPGRDEVAGMEARGLYRRSVARPYRLTPGGCSALVADMTAFFSGQREPFFVFSGVR